MMKSRKLLFCSPILFLLTSYTLLSLTNHSEVGAATLPASRNTADLLNGIQTRKADNIRISRSLSQQNIQSDSTQQETSNSALAVNSCLDTLIKAKDTSGLQLSQNSLEEKCPNLPTNIKEKLIQIIKVQKINSRTALLNPIVKNAKIAEFMVKFGADPNVKDENEDSALHLAAERGNLKVIEWLLDHTTLDVNTQNKDGYTALHLSSESTVDNLDTLRYLINLPNIDANLLNKNNDSALKVAKSNLFLNYSKTKVLLQSGKFTEDISEYIQFVLFYAAGTNDKDTVQWVINNYLDHVNTTDKRRSNAIFEAVEGNNLEILKMLVETGKINLYDRNEVERAPQHVAAELGHLDMIKYLLEGKHVDLKYKTYFNSTVLTLAVVKNHFDIVKYLNENYEFDINEIYYIDRNALLDACEEGNFDILKYLILNASANINVTDAALENVLHRASRLGHLDIVKFLIKDLKYPVNRKNYLNETALHLAAYKGHLEVVKYLVEVGRIDVNAINIFENNALQNAAINGKNEVVDWLRTYQANLH